MSIRIVVADDHRIVRDGLAALLAREADLELVGQAEDGHAALRCVRELQPDVLVTDVAMPGLNGIEAIRRIRADHPAVKTLCLSMHGDSRMVMGMIDAGAAGYVLKDCAFDELGRAIRKVMAGQIYLSPDLVGVVVHEARKRTGGAASAGQPAAALTPREREMVQLLSEGHSTAQIAERLHVSAKTVATHRENILHKLNMRSIAELTRYAIREGLSSLDAVCGAS
jgi:DNA-binding NarL/FixJ family response regulator